MKWTTCARGWLLAVGLLTASVRPVSGQSARQGLPPLDSLQAQLRRTDITDSARVILLGQVSAHHQLTDMPQATADARTGLAIARRAKFRYGEVQMLNVLSRLAVGQSDNIAATRYARQVLRLAGHDRRSELLRMLAMQNLANINGMEENYPQALSYYRQVVDRYPAFPQEMKLGGRAIAQSYMAQAYLDWYEQAPADSLLQAAQLRARLALAEARSLHNLVVEALSLGNLGSIKLNLNQLDSAVHYLQPALAAARQAQYPQLIAGVASELAECYRRQNTRWPDVEKLATESLSLAEQIEDPYGKSEAQRLLAAAYEHAGRWPQAFAALEAHTTLRDTLVRQERRETTARLTTEFETERKEHRIRTLTQQQQVQQVRAVQQQTRVWGLGVGLALLALLLGGVGWTLRRTRRLNRQLDEQKRVVEAQAAELTELDAAKTQFFANISHELRTPLTLIVGPVEQLLTQPPAPLAEPVRERLTLVLRNGQRLQTLVNGILDLTKLTAGKLDVRPVPVRTASFFRQVTGMFESLAQDRSLTLTADVQLPEDLTVLVDPDRAEVIVANLLINALKFTPAGGRVALAVAPAAAPDTYRVTVTDTGPGIAPDEQARVFERFYQSRARRVQGGTGIGLALSRELAEVLGGDLTLRSQLGEGSTFTFTFRATAAPTALAEPVVRGAQPALASTVAAVGGSPSIAENADDAPVTRPDGARPRLLIVEDNADLRVYLRQILGPHYDILEAEHGRAALDILERESVDLISSDAMMPEMDGIELLERVKAHPQWRRLPFLMLTARADAEHRLSALELGVDDYLPKPFLARELLARVRNLLVNYHERLRWQTTPELTAPELAAELPAAPAVFADGPPAPPAEAAIPGGASSGAVPAVPALLAALWALVPAILAEADYAPATLATQLHLSERTLYRRLKEQTGLTPAGWLREVRLDKARQLLESRALPTVAEVAYAVGFTDANYFGQVYAKRFGKRPSEY